jgi:hypothetical protein
MENNQHGDVLRSPYGVPSFLAINNPAENINCKGVVKNFACNLKAYVVPDIVRSGLLLIQPCIAPRSRLRYK